MATITAENILEENDYTTTDISKARVEALIDNAIDYINMQTGLTMSNMSGTRENKTVTVTSGQSPVVKAWASLYVRAHVDHGPNATVPDYSITTVSDDPQINLLKDIAQRGIVYLRDQHRKGLM